MILKTVFLHSIKISLLHIRIKLGKSVFFKRGSSNYLALVEILVVLEGLSFFSFI